MRVLEQDKWFSAFTAAHGHMPAVHKTHEEGAVTLQWELGVPGWWREAGEESRETQEAVLGAQASHPQSMFTAFLVPPMVNRQQ
jgi:hypothetical protein